MNALPAFACFEQPANLVHLRPNRSGEPRSSKSVVNPAQRAVAQVKFLNVTDLSASVHMLNLEPSMQVAGDPVLNDNVNAGRPLPGVPSDHGTLELSEKFAILTSNHSIGKIGQLRHPDHLGVRLHVLRGVEDEVKRFVRGDALCDGCAFSSDHDSSPYLDGVTVTLFLSWKLPRTPV